MEPMSVGGLIAQLRTERTLSQARLAELLADISGNPAITRHEVSRWERGQRQPRRYWLHWIALVFDLSLDDLEDAARLAGPMNDEVAEAAELVHSVAATDVSARTLERLETAVDDLATAYPSTPPGLLLPRVRRHLGYVGKLLDGRSTLAQQRRLMVTVGWLSLLAATIDINLDQRLAAAARPRTAAQLANHGEHHEIAAWVLETQAWEAVTDGHYRRAVALSQAAQRTAPSDSSAFHPSHGTRGPGLGPTWASAETLSALNRVGRLVSELPMPERPEHHFRYDPSKAEAYVATTLSWVGDPAAERYARQVLARLEAPADGPPRPRHAASARLDLALALVTAGKPDEAAGITLQSIESGRLVPSNYWRAREVIQALDDRALPEAEGLKDAFRSLPTS